MKMKKKNKKDIIFRLTSEEATLSKIPKYNGFASGYGAHGDLKYNRNKEKDRFKKEEW